MLASVRPGYKQNDIIVGKQTDERCDLWVMNIVQANQRVMKPIGEERVLS